MEFYSLIFSPLAVTYAVIMIVTKLLDFFINLGCHNNLGTAINMPFCMVIA